MKYLAIFILFGACATAQTNFQPPSWGQGQGPQDPVSQQIQRLQEQINKLRQQQRRDNSPPVLAQVGPVTGHPISGKEIRRTTQTLADGSQVDRSDVSYFYRDTAGRMRAEGPNRVQIFDSVGRFHYALMPANKTYVRDTLGSTVGFVSISAFGDQSHSDIDSDAYTDQPSGGTTQDLGHQTINGITAHGSRVTIIIPAGALGNNREIKVVNERWYSDELKILVKSINSDPRFGVNAYELTDIKQSNPAESLFTPPADYTLTTRRN